MPKRSGKSGLAEKYGKKLDNAVKDHSGDETNYGGLYGQLPGGIKGGIAKLTKCYFKQFEKGANKGEYFFYAEGTVVEPDESDGVKIRGLMTSFMEPVCDTTTQAGKLTSQDEHTKNILNEMRKLGIDTEGAGAGDLEELAKDLATAAPYFRFGTSQSEPTELFPTPRIWENWNGIKGVEDYEPDSNDGVVDKTEEKSSTSSSEDVPFGDDLDMLADSAESGDEESASKLSEIASEAGVGSNFVDNAKSWNLVTDEIRKVRKNEAKDIQSGEVVNLTGVAERADADPPDEEAVDFVTKAGEAAGVEDTFETYTEYAKAIVESPDNSESEQKKKEDWEPEKEEICIYKPPGSKKEIECEITAVFKGKKTVNLKNLDTGKIYKQVKWEKLSV